VCLLAAGKAGVDQQGKLFFLEPVDPKGDRAISSGQEEAPQPERCGAVLEDEARQAAEERLLPADFRC
jgi:hypothetical protein